MDERKLRLCLLVESGTISAQEAARVWTGYFREARINIVATFLIVTFLMSGGAVFFFKNFWPFRFDSMAALGIGSLFGAGAGAWLFFSGFRDYFEIRSDLQDWKCEILTVTAERAIRVTLNETMPGVALDCGDDTLLLLGGWWENTTRREVWTKLQDQARFPASRFIMRRLPRSGRVLGIEIVGNQLAIQQEDGTGPILNLDAPAFMETWSVHEPISALIAKGRI